MKYSKQEDVYYNTAKELGVSKDLVKLVVDNFWKTIRGFLSSPLQTKKGILLSGFGSFFINPFTVNRKLETVKKKEGSKEVINFNVELLKQLDEGKDNTSN